ncbi:hypothetical protein Val02_50130 [Virgisporangium aliadipatigenens]|uniref:GerMN domain-containing protein n=1 Tax=Virgisporangium aliadipatigenens TaxID=741659 RepID=A0A8J3YPJ5_9ACTN|nr:GerMN domain-containing protein [Virgisporangium aliadipatigenens]GIJ48127.1 hypothetical protein Val02_50130 [Virgisporangium aliadipatigenens]
MVQIPVLCDDAAPPVVSTLVDVRAADHGTFDRLVFEFDGPPPFDNEVRFVSQVVADGSGAPEPTAGDAFLRVTFYPATGHGDGLVGTFGPERRTFSLPNLIQVNAAGDYEAVLTFVVGLAQATAFRVTTLLVPSRIVIDVDRPARTVPVQVYFVDDAAQQRSRSVSRPVIPPATSRGALQRLFAGPTEDERKAGLRFVDSHAGGFAGVTIEDGVARVILTDGCACDGSTVSIANEIMPTLKQFPSVRFVKIFDPCGRTEQPVGQSDSVPISLEP